MALKYESVTHENMRSSIAHYYCELGEIAFAKKQNTSAIEYFEKANRADKLCVRASLLKAKVLMENSDYKNAIHSLKNIKDQNPDYISESIELLALCYEKLDEEENSLII